MIDVKKKLRTTTAMLGVMIAVAGGSGVAFAQTQPAQTQSQQQNQQQNQESSREGAPSTVVEEVVITGSRIARSSAFTSPQPIEVITVEEVDLRGIADVGNALQSTALAVSSFQVNDQLTGYVVGGGGGNSSLSLRGLGAQRTLTIVNGRRAGPAGVRGQVQAFDMNTMPQSIVERVEILKDGASSVYGSDAVAGVVNIITRARREGGEISYWVSQPFVSGGEQYRLDANWGTTFDRGYISVGAEYFRANALTRSDRPDTACAEDFVFDPDTGQRLDYIDPRTGQYKCYNLTMGYAQAGSLNLVRTDRYGSLYDYNVAGNDSPYAGWERFARGGFPDTFLYQPTDSALWNNATVISPNERYTLNFNGAYEIAPSVELYTELLYHNRVSSQIGVAQIFPSFAARNVLFGASNFLPASNPNNPFGVNALYVTGYESSAFQEVDYYRGVVGIRGDATLAGRAVNWDLLVQYSRSEADYDFGPRMYLDRFLAVSGPNVACNNNPLGGNVSGFDCADLPDGVPWMSARVLNEGRFTEAERDFLFFRENNTTMYEHAYIEGVMSTSSLFTLPAGPVGAAVGFQIRRERIDDQPGPQASSANMALYSSAGRTRGSDTVREVFGEIELPLLRGLPLIQGLDVNLSARYSDYDSYGDTATYRASLNWTLTPEFRVRASTGTSFRAPALYELFLGNLTAYSSQAAADPCINYGTSGVAPEIVAACQALGIPDNYNAGGGSSVLVNINGGAGVLEAETARTNTFGLIWTPRFANLSVALDYVDISIEDEVRQFGAYNIVEQCLRGNQQFCSLFIRDPDNFWILQLNNSYVNVARQDFEGIDLTLRYIHDFGPTRLLVSSVQSWKLRDEVNLLGGAIEDYRGTTFGYGGPSYSGNIQFTVTRGDWTVFYGIDAIGRGSDLSQGGVVEVGPLARYADFSTGNINIDCNGPLNYCVRYKRTTEFTTYHTASLRYDVNDWTFQVGVNNLFDERPPAQSTGAFRLGTAALNAYDMRGRRGFARITRRF